MPKVKMSLGRYLFMKNWRRSKKGNLCQTLLMDGRNVVIFPRGDGYAFLVADEYGPEFSPETYPTEPKAVRAVWDWWRER